MLGPDSLWEHGQEGYLFPNPADLSEQKLGARGMGRCLDIPLSGQASPLGISSWSLGFPLPALLLSSSRHLTTHSHSQMKAGLTSKGHLCSVLLDSGE